MPYGSEWHLLRYLGRHRARLNNLVAEETKGTVLSWLDFPFCAPHRDYFGGPIMDAEWQGLDFLADDILAKQEWPDFWPRLGQHGDAVGLLQVGTQPDVLLVEAKANVADQFGQAASHSESR